MNTKTKKERTSERGQILPLMVLATVTLIALAGIVIDFGRIMVARAELTRSVDAAALAGTLELPDLVAAQASVTTYMTENDPTAVVEVTSSPADRQIEVSARKTVDVWFIDVLDVIPGFSISPDTTVRSRAVAGFGLQPVDVHVAIDATGSMGASPCNGSQTNSGCPIKEAKDAASVFVDTLLGSGPGSGATQVGVAAFRGCYDPPRSYSRCVDEGVMTLDLTSDKNALDNTISNISSQGGSGTNICWGMLRAEQDLFGPSAQTDSNTLKILVILSDGDNTYNANSHSSSESSPPDDCHPWTSSSQSDHYVGSACNHVTGSYTQGHGRERQLDILTDDKADNLKSQGVEIYVVAFGVCGNSNSNLCDTGIIGSTTHDNTADRNLNKCIASSNAGTNDHYFEVSSASDLPAVFESIAQQIGFRIIE